ncbi:hypothetical protein BDU57DRAFT_556414 [Ampelomyces quisqualis]|uniref:M protein, serotype 2.1 n=1 Tax=Ampelomyces quisqualis TaxID=50730 RepID=A0A6A5QKL8_AMPQU|nr:hypothetical protein BDU57DRAFT_556414 [Ampelomyces quisqualis]
MSTAAAKPPSTGTPRRDAASKNAASSPAAANRTPARGSTPTRNSTPTTNGTGGVTSTRSVRSAANGAPISARAAVRKPAAPSHLSSGASQADTSDEEAKEEQAAYLHELKERLQKAETEAEERQKVVQVLNARLDEALLEQAKLEERAHEEEEKVESLENVKREITRQHRELEGIYEAERAQAMKEKEETLTREEELQETIQRLKEAMASKNGSSEGEEDHVSRASNLRKHPSRTNSSQNLEAAGSFAPPSSVHRSDSRSNSKLINQKDKIIEGLRLELAEYQVKMLEVESAGGGRMHELEKLLLETRMTNARLMEDNESFQLLLGEKTLNGDLSRGDFLRESSHSGALSPARSRPSTSLADELESAEEADVEAVRRLEGELSVLRGENKALTLYINKIIGRILTYKGFESVLGNDADGDAAGLDTNKELPPPPPESDQPQGFLQRAKTVAMGGNRKPRPLSMMGPPPTTNQQSVNEDPSTAPSIPLSRSASTRMPSGSYTHHRRSASGVMAQPGASDIVNKMVQSTTAPTSPGFTTPRNPFFGLPVNNANATPGTSNPVSRVPSGQQVPTTNAIQEEKEGDTKSDANSQGLIDMPSPSRRLDRSETAGPMTGKGMRPLRLVQNEQEAAQARNAAKRASWFGGLFGQAPPKQEQQEN